MVMPLTLILRCLFAAICFCRHAAIIAAATSRHAVIALLLLLDFT